MDPLSKLGVKYGTDKSPWSHGGTSHQYTPWYHEEFGENRGMVNRVFELGINDGASIRMWEEYFSNAIIYAADIHRPGVDMISSPRIEAHYVDQHDAASLVELRNWLPYHIDLMIDDGNHDPDDQAMTCNILAERLAPGGYYVIEDVPAGKGLYVANRILWPWDVTIVEFDIERKSDDRLIVLERPRA